MNITATELKQNLSKYLSLSEREDIFITKNGKIISKLSNPYYDNILAMQSLFGIIPKDVDTDQLMAERRTHQ